ncbi:MAG: carboxy-S-adenosyl-L-methionine synthase CmoA [Desulfobulbus sp.]|nr:carboxy-S-adenosyl-L-methionine synthase CmoA [Desulfobulbus sp.]
MPDSPQDTLFASGVIAEDFTFNEHVAAVFDDMLDRSIPCYRLVIDAMAQILSCHLQPGTTVYDLGCSTGTTIFELTRRLPGMELTFIGIDNAPAMVAKARTKSAQYSKNHDIHFKECDITSCSLPGAGAILCNYTLQFLRPLARQSFINRIFAALPSGGVFILSEKTIALSSRLNRDFIEIYHSFKKQQGYSELEIAAKREALENVLIPFTIRENTALLEQAGFSEIEPFFTWFNFSSIVALKR